MTLLDQAAVQTITLHTPAGVTTSDLGEIYVSSYTTASKSAIVFDGEMGSVFEPGLVVKSQEIRVWMELADFPDESRTYPLADYAITYNSQYYRVVSARKSIANANYGVWRLVCERIPKLMPWAYSSLTNEPVHDALVSLYTYLGASWATVFDRTAHLGVKEIGTSLPMLSLSLRRYETERFAGDYLGSSVKGVLYRVTAVLRCTSAESPEWTNRALSKLGDGVEADKATLQTTYGLQVLDTRIESEPSRIGGSNLFTNALVIEFRCQGIAITAPGAPTALAAAEASSTVTLTWTAPSSTGGSPITAYTVYRSTDGTTYTAVGTASASPYTEASPSAGKLWYKVTASNVAGEGSASSAATLDVPGVPTGLAVSSARVLTWTAPSSMGGSALINYRIYRGTTSGVLAPLAVTNPTTYSDTSADPLTDYYYAVLAYNARGDGSQCSEIYSNFDEYHTSFNTGATEGGVVDWSTGWTHTGTYVLVTSSYTEPPDWNGANKKIRWDMPSAPAISYLNTGNQASEGEWRAIINPTMVTNSGFLFNFCRALPDDASVNVSQCQFWDGLLHIYDMSGGLVKQVIYSVGTQEKIISISMSQSAGNTYLRVRIYSLTGVLEEDTGLVLVGATPATRYWSVGAFISAGNVYADALRWRVVAA